MTGSPATTFISVAIGAALGGFAGSYFVSPANRVHGVFGGAILGSLLMMATNAALDATACCQAATGANPGATALPAGQPPPQNARVR